MNLMKILVSLGLDSEGFKRGLGDAEKRSRESGSNINRHLSQIGGFALKAGLAAAGAGFIAFGVGLSKGMEGARESVKINQQLDAVLTSTAGAAGVTAKMAQQLASDLSKVTDFEDDAILSTENMLLTFTNISKNVFPDVTAMALDMSAALGQDTKSSAMQLGKALNNPIEGMAALQRVGVSFTTDQERMIKTLQKAGKMEEAQGIILAELAKEFGGSAKAVSSPFVRMKNAVGEVWEDLGKKLLPSINYFAKTLINFVSSEKFTAFMAQLGVVLSTAANAFVVGIIPAIQSFVSFIQSNMPLVVGALAGVAAAIGVYIYGALAAAIPAVIAFVTAFAPALAVIAAIALVAGLLYAAWTTNFWGIRDTLTQVWEGTIKPAFNALVTWLQVNIPLALNWLSTTWTTVLLPAIMAVWSWMSTVLFPFFSALGTLVGAVLGKAFEALAALWQNILVPAAKKLFTWLDGNLGPIIKKIAEWIDTKLKPAFDGLNKAIEKATGWIASLAQKINSLKLPDWLTPGSPTPFEIGLLGINDALKKVSKTGLPDFNAQANLNPVMNTGGIQANIPAQVQSQQTNVMDMLLDMARPATAQEIGIAVRDAMLQIGLGAQ